MEFIRRHPQSPLSLFIAGGLLNNTFARSQEEVEELGRIAAGIDDTVRRPVVLKMVEKARSLYKGAPYKEIELTDAEGRTVKLSQYLQPDRYTLVDFWASWCGPCRWAIPKVEQLYKRYDREQMTAAQQAYHISGIPRLMLIAPDGAIVFSGNNADALRLAVEKYLGK